MTRPSGARGQSAVIAVVLLLGLVVAGSVAVFVLGSESVDRTRESAHEERVENSFRALDDAIDGVAVGGSGASTVRMGLSDREGVTRRPDAGRIVVETEGGEAVNRTIGAVRYDEGDVAYAYQAGGVWRGTGRSAVMVSPPPITYRDASLTLPITVLSGERDLSGSEMRIVHNRTRSPVADPGVVRDDLVSIRITSDYYAGWAQFFRQRVSNVAVSVDHGNRTVLVELGRPSLETGFSEAVLATGANGDLRVGTQGNARIDGPAAAEGSITVGPGPPSGISGPTSDNDDRNLDQLDAAIRRMLDAAATDPGVATVDVDTGPTSTLTAGAYYDPDGLTLVDQSLQVDLSAGNVTLYVEGDVSAINASLTVINGGGPAALRIYTDGNYSQKNARVGALRSGTNAEDVQVYGTSEMLVGIGGGGTTHFEGVIYAPREDQVLAPGEPNPAYVTGTSVCDGVDVCVATGNPTVEGAIVGGRAGIEQSAQVVYDSDVGALEPVLVPSDDGVLPPPITYLNVVVHEVTLEDDERGS